MEKRAILAAVLAAAVLILWQVLFAPAPPSPPPVPPPPESKPAPAPLPPPPAPPLPRLAPPQRGVTVETPLYRAVVTSQGGALEAWDLYFRGEKPMVLKGIVAQNPLTVHRAGAPPVPVAFELSGEPLRLDKGMPQGRIRMVGEDGFGLRITEVLTFRADTYVVEHEIRVENRHGVAQGAELTLAWVAPAEWPKDQEGFRGPRPISVVRLGPEESWAYRVYLKDAKEFSGSGWIGFESGVAPTGVNGVYLTALIPRSSGIKVTERMAADGPAGQGKAPKQGEIGIRAVVPTLEPGRAWEGKFLQYLGPMEYERLQALGVGLEKAIYFGGFPFTESAARSGFPTFPVEWIVVPLLRLMRWLNHYIPNYGVAIIILTVITKILFYPLTLKSLASMKAMQALQPQVNALKAKYQKDPQRLQRATMELYREHKVNPMGGCLPMVVQIPVFIALYAMLTVSTELQGAPFIYLGILPAWVPWLGGQCVWICDLATYDPTYVFPLLMGVSMFVQQKMTPTVGDPRQAKIMLLMPVMFTFFFLNLASGLVLYWFVSNVLQILQQYWMDRHGRAKAGTGKESFRNK